MHNRLRLLQGTTALLYLGPLLAGLGGFGWSVVPVFAAIFLLWLFILRPQQWPRRAADWLRPEALTALAAQAAMQVLLVTLCFGIGRGIGGVLGALPPFPLMLPIAVSFLSIPLSRLIWDPWKAAELDAVLDGALAALQDMGGAAETPDALRNRTRLAARMVEELEAMGPGVEDARLAAHLAAMGTQVDAGALRVALMDPIYDQSATEVIWRAAVLHATDPAVQAQMPGALYPQAVFRELQDPALIARFAERALALVSALPEAAADCPDVADLEAEAMAQPRLAPALRALAKAIDAAGPGTP